MEPKKKSENQVKTWNTKLFECCDDDCGMFIFGVVCANTSIPQMYERVGRKGFCFISTLLLWSSFTLALTIPVYIGLKLNYWGILWGSLSLAFFVLFSCSLVFFVRTRIRKRKQIKGNTLDDACTSFWCCCCSHMQHMREDGLSIENYNLTSVNAV